MVQIRPRALAMAHAGIPLCRTPSMTDRYSVRPLAGALVLAALSLAACDSGVEPPGSGPGADENVARGCNDAEVNLLVNARATYLMRTPEDTNDEPQPLRLAQYDLAPGDSLRLLRFGEYRYVESDPDAVEDKMVGVFSTSSTLRERTARERVVGAIDVGRPYETAITSGGQLPTDIEEDFLIDSVDVRVPTGAAYLFVAPDDGFYGDNLDEDRDFKVCIQKLD